MRHTSFPLAGLLLLTTACFTPEPPDIADDGGEGTGTTTGSATTAPSATNPSSTDPSATDPSATDPSATNPSTTDPSATDSSSTNASDTDPSSTTDSITTAVDSSSSSSSTDATMTESQTDTSTTDEPCDEGFLDCGSGMCDVDANNDAMNCGACGHDCLGGECSDGACEPISLIFNSAISAIAADEDNVYFSTSSGSSSGSAGWIPQVAGATSTTLVDEFGSSNRRVLVDNTHVYIEGGSNSSTGYVARVAKTGGAWLDLFDPEPGSFLGGPSNLVLSPSRAIWSTTTSSGGTSSYFIRGMAKDGQGNSISYLSNGTEFLGTLGANSTFLFFYQGQSTQELRRRSHGIGGTSSVLSGVVSANAIAADNDGVYFAGRDESSGLTTLWSMDADGGNPTILVASDDPEFDDGEGLLISEDELVWADIEAGGAVFRTIGTDGSNLRTIANGVVGTNQFNQFDDGSLSADSEAYFYYSDSQIWMLAK